MGRVLMYLSFEVNANVLSKLLHLAIHSKGPHLVCLRSLKAILQGSYIILVFGCGVTGRDWGLSKSKD